MHPIWLLTVATNGIASLPLIGCVCAAAVQVELLSVCHVFLVEAAVLLLVHTMTVGSALKRCSKGKKRAE